MRRATVAVVISLAVALIWPAACTAAAAPPVAVDGGVKFSYDAPSATSVNLAGEFNSWDPASLPMADEDGDGVWTVTLEVAPGRYDYKFVIDGGASWEPDVGNPERVGDNHGGENSILVVE